MHELDRITHLLFSPTSQFMIAKSDIKSFLCSVFADFQHVERLIEVCFSCASNEVERGGKVKGGRIWNGHGDLGTRLAWFFIHPDFHFVRRSIFCGSSFFPSFLV